MQNRRPHILIYSHDTYGLGHLRRCQRIAFALSRLPEKPSILIATGSPRADAFNLPPGCDILKLPCIQKLGNGRYGSLRLSGSLEDLKRLRSALLLATVESFWPDLILVDHAPVGVEGELLPVLELVNSFLERPCLVLGLRDVIDDHRRVQDEWDRLGAWRHVTNSYDRILVYGDAGVLTTAHELGLPEALGRRVVHTGFVAPRPEEMGAPPWTGRFVATIGGGADGAHVARAFMTAVNLVPDGIPLDPVVVCGPFLPEADRKALERESLTSRRPVTVCGFDGDLHRLLAGADGVVAMGGYNTMVELMVLGRPALIVPRERPRQEQLIRVSRLLGRVPFLSMARAGSDLPAAMAAFMTSGRAPETDPAGARVRLDGADVVAEELGALIRDASATRRGGRHASEAR